MEAPRQYRTGRWDLDHKIGVGLDRVVQFRRWITGKKSLKPLPPDESLGPARLGEVRPPWIEHPGYESWDGFWRQSGELWFAYTWEPFYKSLTPEQQTEYLAHWKVPDEWKATYFNPEWWDNDEDDDAGNQRSKGG